MLLLSQVATYFAVPHLIYIEHVVHEHFCHEALSSNPLQNRASLVVVMFVGSLVEKVLLFSPHNWHHTTISSTIRLSVKSDSEQHS